MKCSSCTNQPLPGTPVYAEIAEGRVTLGCVKCAKTIATFEIQDKTLIEALLMAALKSDGEQQWCGACLAVVANGPIQHRETCPVLKAERVLNWKDDAA